MARRRRNPPLPNAQLVTPENGTTKELKPLTFGSFLPQKLQSAEALHAEGDPCELPLLMTDAPSDIAARQLQFTDTTGSEKSSLTAADVVRGNRNTQRGKQLSFVPPTDRDGKKVVKISEDDLKPQRDYWQNALIGFIIGDNPSEKTMDKFFMHVWNFVAKSQVLIHAEGYCIFRFNSIEDRDLVMQSGPYSYWNKPMVLKPWEVDFTFQRDVLSTVPVWIRFPGLPVGYWSTEVLSKMASAVGKPLYTDKFTAHYEKISFARVLVEVDAAYSLPDQLEIETPYGSKIHTIEYD